ncbi:MAG: hypothetical protein E7494_01225 [Ruminococcus albus]|nr:hypothetical protein [Ruminococcus albus]
MRMYRSLIFRSFRLKRTRDRLFLVLILLLDAAFSLMSLVLCDDPSEIKDDVFMFCVFSFMLAMLCGMIAGANNGVYRMDTNTGWERYIRALPPTPMQQAVADLLIKLIYILIYGTILMIYATFSDNHTGLHLMCYVMNIFLFFATLFVIIDIVYSFVVRFAQTRAELELMSLAAFVCGIIIIVKLCKLIGNIRMYSPVQFGNPLFGSTSYIFASFVASGKVTAVAVSSFVISLGSYFLVMWRLHERREM